MNISEDIFASWSQGPGKTEADKCTNAESAVRDAIADDGELSKTVPLLLGIDTSWYHLPFSTISARRFHHNFGDARTV